ncbi:inner membrane protein YehU [Enterobacter asburiae]|uniref:Inner membrane protein YehU n=1 Tax=Enterobacter asburiae TaxID=61645 RepID=A0A376FPG3_ENTAS|nr:inner membrane protein YehU [Enterobacter asburiae]
MQFLSTFFRKNLKRPSEIVTLADEIEHVNAYLQIEQARFQSRLQVSLSVPDELAYQHLPAFTLQPIVENAIKTRHITASGNGGRSPLPPAVSTTIWCWILKIMAGPLPAFRLGRFRDEPGG